MSEPVIAPLISMSPADDKTKTYKMSHTMMIFILTVYVLILAFAAYHKVKNRLPKTLQEKLQDHTAFGQESLQEFKGDLEKMLELGRGENCAAEWGKIKNKINLAIKENNATTQGLETLLEDFNEEPTNTNDCNNQMDAIRAKHLKEKSWLNRVLSSQRIRWYIFLGATLVMYVFMFYEAHSSEKTPENMEAAMWLNPSVGGYRVNRGDVNSPSLYNFTDPWEIVTNVGILIITIACALWVYRVYKARSPNLGTEVVQIFILWIHLVLLVYLLPVNPFHERFLYNMRSYAATVVDRPSYELLLAFIFIVLLPLPGVNPNASASKRLGWLAFKLGLFYMIQSVMLGPPHYSVESYNADKVWDVTTRDVIYYGIVIGLSIVVLVMHKF
jgi:hypothetical protein